MHRTGGACGHKKFRVRGGRGSNSCLFDQLMKLLLLLLLLLFLFLFLLLLLCHYLGSVECAEEAHWADQALDLSPVEWLSLGGKFRFFTSQNGTEYNKDQ